MFVLPNKMNEYVIHIMRKFIKTYDSPNAMISDNAVEFTSEAMQNLCATTVHFLSST